MGFKKSSCRYEYGRKHAIHFTKHARNQEQRRVFGDDERISIFCYIPRLQDKRFPIVDY